MSGALGAGKATIARELVRHRRLVSLDHDIVKSALLDSDGAFEIAGAASYGVLLALADDVLAQGFGVIIDSPCFYDELLAAGQDLAAKHGVPYRYLECVTDDIEMLDSRLRSRPALRSQRPSVGVAPVDLAADHDRTGPELFAHWIANMKRPSAFLRLDTSRPVDECVAQALAFLDGAGA